MGYILARSPRASLVQCMCIGQCDCIHSEMTKMTKENSVRSGRCLAEIESNLREAENAFADADARYRQADQDRQTAVETINQHQAEIDDAVRQLRDLSIPGTHWSAASSQEGEPLVLNSGDMLSREKQKAEPAGNLSSQETKRVIARDLERLRTSADPDADDPVLKVVTNRGS